MSLVDSFRFATKAQYAPGIKAAFQAYAPNVYSYYQETMCGLRNHHANLRPNFTKSAFAAATFNLGPRTITRPHIDHLNLPTGWCAITALGSYDPKLGGHLVLWDLKLIVEFPPGSTILIPSAIFRHSNLPIGEDGVRYSFTQYSAGGLFRWVSNGFRSQKEFDAEGGRKKEGGCERWIKGLELFSTMEELCALAKEQ